MIDRKFDFEKGNEVMYLAEELDAYLTDEELHNTDHKDNIIETISKMRKVLLTIEEQYV